MTAYPKVSIGRMVAVTLVMSSVIALALTFFGHASILHNMVFSYCIGLSTYALIDLPRRRLWPQGPPPLLPMLVLVLGAAFAGWFVGSALGGALLGMEGQPWTLPANAVIGFIVLTTAAGLVGTYLFWTREQIAASEHMATQARLKLLTAQIEPHFLFNTLANLDALITVDPVRAKVMLAHLDRYLRATLAATHSERATLGEEFALLATYLEIIAIRMGPRLSFKLDLPTALADRNLPPMLLQPLVENAVRHGLEPKIEGGSVRVSAREEGGQLVLRVEDNGIGAASTAQGGAGGGMGLRNVRERLAAAFGHAASAEMAAGAAGGTCVTLRLPDDGGGT